MMLGNSQGMYGMMRQICNHDLRMRLTGKLNVCLICQCNKIDNLVLEETYGNRKVSSDGISEIIYQFRVINSVLDCPIKEEVAQILCTRVFQTSLDLLKTHNDELGAVVAQALDKISNQQQQVPGYILEDFLTNLSNQILEKISYGNLDCLSVLIRRKEYLSSFLRNDGPSVVLKLAEELERLVSAMPFPPSAQLSFSASTAMESQSTEINSCEIGSQHFVLPVPTISGSTTSSGRESLKIVEKLFDVIDESCPSGADASPVFTITNTEDNERKRFCSAQRQNHQGQHSHSNQQTLSSFQPTYLTSTAGRLNRIISVCMNLLNFTSSRLDSMPSFSAKILNFLKKLSQSQETLQHIFTDSGGVAFCSLIKKQFYSRSTEIKIATLNLVNRMVVTYKKIIEKHGSQTLAESFPIAISRVDLVHFIGEAMNTSCENLFRTAIQVLDQINLIPLFRPEKMIPLLETTLRISVMHIPDNITDYETYLSLNNLILNVLTSLDAVPLAMQRQLIYLFEKLPKEWTGLQYLSWIKLLLFCSDPCLERNIWSLFYNFVQQSKTLGSHCYYVIHLKCILLIVRALMKMKCINTECSQVEQSLSLPVEIQQQQLYNSQKDELTKHLMFSLMDSSFLPAIMALVEYGTSDDIIYVTTLLELVKLYPPECFSVSHKQISFNNQEFDTVKVTFGSEQGQNNENNVVKEEQQDPTYNIKVDRNSTIKINEVWCWSAKIYMQILMSVRLNPKFITSRILFDLWNENSARLISICYPLHLSQLENVCSPCQFSYKVEVVENKPASFDHLSIKQILGKLELDITKWSESIGPNIFRSYGYDSVEMGKRNMILALYFFYAFFVGKEIRQLLDNDFVERFCALLKVCVERYNRTQNLHETTERDFDWTSLSYQYRIALMLASMLPCENGSFGAISDQVESFYLEVDETHMHLEDDVLILHPEVFAYLLRCKIFPDYTSLVEKWLQNDKDGCIAFINGNNDDPELHEEIDNCLLMLASKGSKESSSMAVTLGCLRLEKFNCAFQISSVLAALHPFVQLLQRGDCNSPENIETLQLTLLRFSNVVKLVVKDDYLFLNNRFPMDLVQMIIQIMMTFYEFFNIGIHCLEFLIKILENKNNLKEVGSYLASYHALVVFLGTKMHVLGKGEIQETARAYKLMTILVMQIEDRPSWQTPAREPVWVSWKLTSIFPLLFNAAKLEFLEFLSVICDKRLKCSLIQVQELEQEPKQFRKVLSTLLVHLHALTRKVTLKRAADTVWEILSKILILAVAENEYLTSLELYNEVLFQPVVRLVAEDILSDCKNVPSKGSVNALEFLRGWTNFILVYKFENPRQGVPIERDIFRKILVNQFETILKAMKNDPSQTPVPIKVRKTPVKGDIIGTSQPRSSAGYFDIQSKSQLISKIAYNCELFLTPR